MKRKLQKTAVRLIGYYMEDIDWQYDQLTSVEQNIISEKKFNKLKKKAFK